MFTKATRKTPRLSSCFSISGNCWVGCRTRSWQPRPIVDITKRLDQRIVAVSHDSRMVRQVAASSNKLLTGLRTHLLSNQVVHFPVRQPDRSLSVGTRMQRVNRQRSCLDQERSEAGEAEPGIRNHPADSQRICAFHSVR